MKVKIDNIVVSVNADTMKDTMHVLNAIAIAFARQESSYKDLGLTAIAKQAQTNFDNIYDVLYSNGYFK